MSKLAKFLFTPAPSGPFDPGSVSGLVEWHSADVISGSPSDGAHITSWDDQSGNGFVGTGGPDALHSPIYRVGIVNSLPALQCSSTGDGASHQMNLGFTGTRAQPNTYFIVINEDPSNIAHFQDGTGSRNLVGTDGGGTAYQLYAGASVTTGTRTKGSFIVLEATFIGSTGTLYVNGTSVLTGFVSSQGFGGGTQTLCSPPPGVMYIAEYLFYNADIGSTDRSRVRHYLGTKYGISVS